MPTLSRLLLEYHLSQIYRKLDLRSRTQPASLMAQAMPEPSESSA